MTLLYSVLPLRKTLLYSVLPLRKRLLFARFTFALATFRQGDFEATVKRFDKLLPRLERSWPGLVKDARLHLAYALCGLGRHAQAEAHLRIVVENRSAVRGLERASTVEACALLAKTLGAQDRIEQAQTLLDEAVPYAEQLPELWRTTAVADLQVARAGLLLQRGRPAEAAALAGPAHTLLTAVHGTGHYKVLSAQSLWADCLARTGALDHAVRQAEGALAIRTRELGRNHPYTRDSAALLARIENLENGGHPRAGATGPAGQSPPKATPGPLEHPDVPDAEADE
ncbi:tetratricopeptide repeat protein [Streptomyces sp. NPDC050085]|uniref:tetratricopeptide repeat protein n=1 Tax=Streptomyces sp. NPDC050085 TaxID=3365600 RepID=UPI0037A35C3C